MARNEPSETSPLLGKPTAALPDPADSSNSIPPSDVTSNGHQQNGDVKRAADEESQHSDEERAPLYQGIPEVKAKLTYIVPAVSIGVCFIARCGNPF